MAEAAASANSITKRLALGPPVQSCHTSSALICACATNLTGSTRVSDVINRVPKLGARAAYAQQSIREKLLDHRSYFTEHGDDLPEIRNWQRSGAAESKTSNAETAADNL